MAYRMANTFEMRLQRLRDLYGVKGEVIATDGELELEGDVDEFSEEEREHIEDCRFADSILHLPR